MSSPSIPASPWPALSGNALVVLCVLNHTALAGSRVAASLSALSLGASAFEVGVLLALFSLMPTLCSLWIGRWVDRVGTRRPALIGMTLTWAGLALASLRPGLSTLWITAALVGGGYTISLLALQSQLGRCDDAVQRAAGFASFALGTAVSSGLGPFIAGQSLTHGGPSFAFALLAGVSLISWLGALLRRQGLARLHYRVDTAPRARFAMGWIIHNKSLRRILFADLLMAIGWNANGFIVSIYGTQQGWSAAQVGNLFAVFGGAVWLVRALPAAWRQRVGDWQTIRLALLISGLCYALFPFATSLPLAFALEFTLGLGLGSALPSVLSLLHTHAPSGRSGETLGLRVALLNVSYVALPLCLGSVGAAVGMGVVFWSIGGGLSLGAGLLKLARTRGNDQERG